MKYCLLNIAYDSSFHGFQVQPELRTVQGEILKALKPIGIEKVIASSRTDSNVRACSNIIEVKADDCLKVCRIVDSINGIIVRGYFASDEYVKIRGKIRKEYIYVYPSKLDYDITERAVNDYLKSNYSIFSKDPGRKVILESLTFKIFRSSTIFIFKGKSFSWNFVRISSENIVKRSEGKIGDNEWLNLLNGTKRYRYKGKGSNLILYNSEIELNMTPYHSKKIENLMNNERLILYWLKGIGVEIEDLLKEIKDL